MSSFNNHHFQGNRDLPQKSGGIPKQLLAMASPTSQADNLVAWNLETTELKGTVELLQTQPSRNLALSTCNDPMDMCNRIGGTVPFSL